MTDEQKLEVLRKQGLDPATLGAKKKAEAEAQELDSKETDAPAEAPPTPGFATAEDVAATLLQVLTPLVERIEAIEMGVKSLQEPPPDPPSPGDDIMALLQGASIIGKEQSALDGRTARKAEYKGPTETKAEAPIVDASGSAFNSVIGPILDGSLAKTMNDRAAGVAQ